VKAWCQAHLEAVLATLKPDFRYCFGEDLARKGDMSVFVVLAIAPDLSKREALRVELRNVTYDQQKQIMLTILTCMPRLVGAVFNATGNGSYLAEAAQLHFGLDMVDCITR